MPPSTRDIMSSVGSKYAVVVGISKKARIMSAKKELEEKEGHLADMVNHTLEDLIADKLEIHHVVRTEEPETALAEEEAGVEEPVEDAEDAFAPDEDPLDEDTPESAEETTLEDE